MGNYHNMNAGCFVQYEPCRLQTIQSWHADIHYNNIWLEEFALFYRIETVHRFAANLPFRVWLKQSSKSPPENFMVIDD
ncbi:MAG: hypothetical protein ABSA96_19115 [Candidatus Acidiferrales bacterium]